METYPGSGGDAYAPVQQDAYSIPDDYTIPDDSSYSGGGSTGGSSSGVPTGGVGAANYDGPAPPNNVDSDCPRVRKEWNTATTEERQTYIEAILELSEQGILQKFVEQHGNMVSDRQAHGTSAFLPWHR